ncbi:MAG TPA: hypothetical protein VFA43_22960 [Gemmatimonadaceae bacterium]|nr:hypothetical protein [Gemmatimonadaceae bacterium]
MASAAATGAPATSSSIVGAGPRVLATLGVVTLAWLSVYQGLNRFMLMRHSTGPLSLVIAYSKDLLLGIEATAAFLLFLLGVLRIRRQMRPVAVAGAMLALYVLAILAYHAFAVNALYAIRVYGEPLIGGVSVGILVRRGGQRERLPGVLAVASLLIVFIGILQIAFPLAPLTIAFRDTVADPNGELPAMLFTSVGDVIRPFSLLDGPNDLGFFGIIAALATYAPSPWLARRRFLCWVVRGLAVVACMISFSRSALLAGVIGATVLSVAYVLWDPRANAMQVLGRAAIGFMLAVVAIFGLWTQRETLAPVEHTINAVTGADLSARAHEESLRDGLQRALMDPQGVGLGRVGSRAGLYGSESRVFMVESAYLLIAMELGWLGLSIVVLAIGLAIVGALALAADRRTARDDRRWASVAAALFVAQATVFIFLPSIETLSTGAIVWAHLGFILCQPANASG